MGNLVAGLVTEEALRQLFNSTMTAAFPDKLTPGFDPVVNVSMHSEGRYAFVELRTPEMASAALQLSNQVQLLGQSISVGRPSGYVDPSKAQQAASAAAAALAAFKVSLVMQDVLLQHCACADTQHLQKLQRTFDAVLVCYCRHLGSCHRQAMPFETASQMPAY